MDFRGIRRERSPDVWDLFKRLQSISTISAASSASARCLSHDDGHRLTDIPCDFFRQGRLKKRFVTSPCAGMRHGNWWHTGRQIFAVTTVTHPVIQVRNLRRYSGCAHARATAYNRCLERERRLQIRNVTPFAARKRSSSTGGPLGLSLSTLIVHVVQHAAFICQKRLTSCRHRDHRGLL